MATSTSRRPPRNIRPPGSERSPGDPDPMVVLSVAGLLALLLGVVGIILRLYVESL